MPATWQGWTYTLALVIPIIIASSLPNVEEKIRISFILIWAIIFSLDLIHIMANVNKDEREKIHEAIAERNALWTIIFVLAFGVAYQASKSIVETGSFQIDPLIIIAIVLGLIVKASTNFYLDKKD
jgi:cation transport ATPase